MCWVMPPASPAATSVSRIASSSEVLPWSTWPMIVTTGGRSTRSSSASANSGSSGSSSAARTISILRSYSSAIARIDSSVSVWVSVAISPIIISFLITSAGARPIASPSSLHGGAGVDFGRLGLDRGLWTHRRLLEAAGAGDDHRDGAAGAVAAGRPSGRGGRPASRSRRGVFCRSRRRLRHHRRGRRDGRVCSRLPVFWRAGGPGCRRRRKQVCPHPGVRPVWWPAAGTDPRSWRYRPGPSNACCLAVTGVASPAFAGASVAVPPPLESPPRTRLATSSSTLEAATLALTPAAFSFASTSFELMPCAFAIS